MSQVFGEAEHASLELGGAPIEVVTLEGEEGLSRLFRYEITATTDGASPAPEDLLGRDAVVTLRDGFGASRTIHGIVAEVATEARDEGGAAIRVVVRPAAYALTLGRDCRSFQEMTSVEVVKAVLASARFPVRWQLTESYPTHPYTVQYREDDWTFVSRLLEEEGIHHWFDHDGTTTTLVLSDTSPSAPELHGGARIPFAYETGMTASGERIEELGSQARAGATRFTVTSFDPARPRLAVGGGSGSGNVEVYRAPGGGPTSPDQCAAQASRLHQAAQASRAGIAGRSSSVRLVPGMAFEVSDHPLPRFDARWLVTSTRVHVAQRRRGASGSDRRPYACHFTAIRLETPFRPPSVTPAAQQPGLQTGVVIGLGGEEVFPDARGRVRVQQHWDRLGGRDERAGTWVRVAQRGSADSMLLPRIGWAMLTFNEEGTVDAPAAIGRIHDGEHLPPYALPTNKTRLVFKTATTPGGGSHNEIRFEDKKGSEEMFLDASRDMNVLIQRLKSEGVKRDQRRSVGVDETVQVGARLRETVGNDQHVDVAGDEKVKAAKSAARTVGGDETEKVGGSRHLTVGASAQTSAGKQRELRVGAAVIDLTLGSVSATSGVAATLVGGAVVRASGGSVTHDTGKIGVQLVGAARIDMAKRNVSLDVGKRLFETVGGAMVVDSGGVYDESFETSSETTVAAALTGKAPSILIESTEKIELTCGSSVLTITPDAVRLSADAFEQKDAKVLTLDTALVEHNP